MMKYRMKFQLDKSKAEHFNDYFASICSFDMADEELPDTSNILVGNRLSSIESTQQDVIDQLHIINSNKSFREFHPNFLKKVVSMYL